MKNFKRPIDVAFSLLDKQKKSLIADIYTKEDVINRTPFYLRYFVKRKIEKLEKLGPLPKTPEQWRNSLLKLSKETNDNIRSHILTRKIKSNIKDMFEKNIVKNTMENEIKLLMLHMWFLQRRFLFETDKYLANALIDNLWINCLEIIEKNNSPVKIKDLHKLFYGLVEILDEAIEEPNDTKIADVLFELFKFESCKEVYKWVRYIRFENYFFDHMNTEDLTKGNFLFILPNDDLFQEIEEDK